jgi:hypothetical protein|nr:MAG TPA: hypothetical protein [Caudoviricetes sp.]
METTKNNSYDILLKRPEMAALAYEVVLDGSGMLSFQGENKSLANKVIETAKTSYIQNSTTKRLSNLKTTILEIVAKYNDNSHRREIWNNIIKYENLPKSLCKQGVNMLITDYINYDVVDYGDLVEAVKAIENMNMSSVVNVSEVLGKSLPVILGYINDTGYQDKVSEYLRNLLIYLILPYKFRIKSHIDILSNISNDKMSNDYDPITDDIWDNDDDDYKDKLFNHITNAISSPITYIDKWATNLQDILFVNPSELEKPINSKLPDDSIQSITYNMPINSNNTYNVDLSGIVYIYKYEDMEITTTSCITEIAEFLPYIIDKMGMKSVTVNDKVEEITDPNNYSKFIIKETFGTDVTCIKSDGKNSSLFIAVNKDSKYSCGEFEPDIYRFIKLKSDVSNIYMVGLSNEKVYKFTITNDKLTGSKLV